MKAAVFHEYEGPVEIAEVAKPELQDSSVLVEVNAASLNLITRPACSWLETKPLAT